MKRGMEILTLENKSNWDDIVQASNNYDFYHLSSYHHIAELRGEGKAYLFLYKENDKFIAIPFLLRPLWEVKGLEEIAKGRFDVTSVYGYSGPVSNVSPKKRNFILKFGKALLDMFKEKSVVTAFSRLHPIWKNNHFLKIGDLISLGKTVSIDLTLTLEEQFRLFRNNHKRDIKKLRSMGIDVHIDKSWEYIKNFQRIYTASMNRVKAPKYYYFNEQYFSLLNKYFGKNLKLFVAEYDGQIISAGLFSFYNSIIQYHLGGVDPNFSRFSPLKIIFDEVRIWAKKKGAKLFHLGGGLGSTEDGLFHFKAGFSKRLHQFFIWKLVINHSIYEDLKKTHERWRQENQLKLIDHEYFPPYPGNMRKYVVTIIIKKKN